MKPRIPEYISKLITQEKALVKMIQALAGDNQHWVFLLKQLQYPQFHRPIHKLLEKSDRSKIYNPSKNEWQERKITVSRGQYKDIEFTKKTATTLLPKDGRITLFNPEGIGVGMLFDLDFCRLRGQNAKEDKYIFTGNQITNNRWWIQGQPDSDNVTKAVTLDDVRAHNKSVRAKNEIPKHNEILARLSKKALSAIFTRKDIATDRINALHKKFLTLQWLGKDVPVLIITAEAEARLYTQDEMITDLINAIQTKDTRPNPYLMTIELIRYISRYDLDLWAKLSTRIHELKDAIPKEFLLCKGLIEGKNVEQTEQIFNEIKISEEDALVWMDLAQHQQVHLKSKTIQSLVKKSFTPENKENKPSSLDQALLRSITNQYFGATQILLNYLDEFSKDTLAQAMMYLAAYNHHELALIIYDKFPTLMAKMPEATFADMSSPLDLMIHKDEVNERYIKPVVEDNNLLELRKTNLGKIFIALIKQRKIAAAKNLLGKKPDTDVSYIHPLTGNSVLHYLVEDEKINFDLFKSLYPKCKITHKNKDNKTPLLIAIEKNHQEIIDFCLEDKANLNNYSVDQLGKMIFHLAKNNHASLECLLDIILKKECVDKEIGEWLQNPDLPMGLLNLIISKCPQKMAVKLIGYSSYFGMVAYLNKPNLFNIILQNEDVLGHFNSEQLGQVLLNFVKNRSIQEAISLLERKINPNSDWRFLDSNHAIHLAVLDEKPNLKLIQLLHKNNSNLNAKNKDNKTAFLIAAEKNQTEMLEILMADKSILQQYQIDQLEKIINIFVKNSRLQWADVLLEIASTKAGFDVEVGKWMADANLSPELLKLIIKYFPKKMTEKFDTSPSYLGYLCLKNRNNLISVILENDDVIKQFSSDQLGEALLRLVGNKNLKNLQLILEKNRKITKGWNFINTENTVLHHLVLDDKPNEQLVKLMHDNNDFLNLKNKENKTAFLIAAEKNQTNILTIFIENPKILSQYENDQLEKIIVILVRNDRLQWADVLLEIAVKKPGFDKEIEKWMAHPSLSPELLKLIIKHSFNKIADKFLNCMSYLEYLCQYKKWNLISPMLADELILKQFSSSQLGNVLLSFMENKKWNEAICILEKNIEIKKNFASPPTSNSALHHLVLDEKPNEKLIKLLHDNNNSLNFKNKENKTAFLLAAEKNQTTTLSIFMEDKNFLAKYDKDQLEKIIILFIKNNRLPWAETLLEIALKKEGFDSEINKWLLHPQLFPSLLDLLLKHCPQKFKEKFGDKASFLAYICSVNKINLMDVFLKKDIVNQLSLQELGEITLSLVKFKHYDKATILLEQFSNIDKNCYESNSLNRAIHFAVCDAKPDIKLIRLLHQNNPNLNALNLEKKNAFQIAAEKNDQDILKIFIEDQKVLSQYPLLELENTLAILLRNNRFDIADPLLDLCFKNRSFKGLHSILEFIDCDIALETLLLINKNSPGIFAKPYKSYNSFLDYLIWKGKFDLVSQAINHNIFYGFDPNQLSEILVSLFYFKKFDVAKTLLRQFKDKINKNYYKLGITPLLAAVVEQKSDPEMIKILYEDNRSLNFVNKENKTAFLIVAEQNNKELIDIFSFDKEGINQYDPLRLSQILLVLLKNRHYKNIEFILEYYSKFSLLDKFSITKISKEILTIGELSPQLLNKLIQNQPLLLKEIYRDSSSYLSLLLREHKLDLFNVVFQNEKCMLQFDKYALGNILLILIEQRQYDDAKIMLKRFQLYIYQEALFCAVADDKPDYELIKQLTSSEKNADFFKENELGKTTLLVAAEKNDETLIQILLAEFQNKSILQLSFEQLSKILLALMKNNHSKYVESILNLSVSRMDFHKILDQVSKLIPLSNEVHYSALFNYIDTASFAKLSEIIHALAKNTQESKEHSDQHWNLSFLKKLDSSSKETIRPIIEFVVKSFIDVSKSSDQIIALMNDLKFMQPIYEKCYKKKSGNSVFRNFVWERDIVSESWIKLVQMAKTKLLVLVRVNGEALDEQAINFLKMPTERSGTLFASSSQISSYYKEYEELIANRVKVESSPKKVFGPD